MVETRRPNKRAVQARETRRRILEAARDLFVADGYDATAGARKRTPDQVVKTALDHLAKRDPGPSVIDGSSSGPLLLKLLSRRAAVTLVKRVTDPARRATNT